MWLHVYIYRRGGYHKPRTQKAYPTPCCVDAHTKQNTGVLTYFLCFYASSGDFAFDPIKFVVYLLFVIFGAHTGSMQVREFNQNLSPSHI